ncbi:hypothetical protein RUND412_000268 [Rhizina undulata]
MSNPNPKALKASKYSRKHENRKNKHGKNRLGGVPRKATLEKFTKQKKPINEDYVFIAKGDVYVTRNCAKLAKEKGHTVYIIKVSRRTGIQVPKEIYEFVQEMEEMTRQKRAKAVAQRESRFYDLTLATKCLNGMFKQIPPGVDTAIIERAFEKYSGRVGRTLTRSLPSRLRLATIAHIRHNFTSYGSSLSQWLASQDILPDIKRVWMEWGAVESFGTKVNKKTANDYIPDEEECEADIDDKGDGEESCDGEDEDETDEDRMEEEEGMTAE